MSFSFIPPAYLDLFRSDIFEIVVGSGDTGRLLFAGDGYDTGLTRHSWALRRSEGKSLAQIEAVWKVNVLLSYYVCMYVHQAKVQRSCRISEGYGMTEVQGYIAMRDPAGPPRATGAVLNIMHFKVSAALAYLRGPIHYYIFMMKVL
jgi:hypothetical protein